MIKIQSAHACLPSNYIKKPFSCLSSPHAVGLSVFSLGCAHQKDEHKQQTAEAIQLERIINMFLTSNFLGRNKKGTQPKERIRLTSNDKPKQEKYEEFGNILPEVTWRLEENCNVLSLPPKARIQSFLMRKGRKKGSSLARVLKFMNLVQCRCKPICMTYAQRESEEKRNRQSRSKRSDKLFWECFLHTCCDPKQLWTACKSMPFLVHFIISWKVYQYQSISHVDRKGESRGERYCFYPSFHLQEHW